MVIPSFLAVLAVSAAMLVCVQAEQHEIIFENEWAFVLNVATSRILLFC
jgi:hypothetical protein